mgnify:FL=1
MGVKSVFSAYIKPKLPPLNDFYYLIHLFSRSKSKEKELKYTITTIPMKLFQGIGMKLSTATNETIPRNIYETIQKYL